MKFEFSNFTSRKDKYQKALYIGLFAASCSVVIFGNYGLFFVAFFVLLFLIEKLRKDGTAQIEKLDESFFLNIHQKDEIHSYKIEKKLMSWHYEHIRRSSMYSMSKTSSNFVIIKIELYLENKKIGVILKRLVPWKNPKDLVYQ